MTICFFALSGMLQACVKSQTRPQCGFTGGGAPPAKMFAIDTKELLGGDWRVSLLARCC
jgi:hypothetical protein